MIPSETITKIQDAIRIEEVIGDFVSLTRRGASYMACCPFHNEKTPSFVVTPAKGIFKCFGCGESGTAVSFLMKHENMSFVEAMRYLGKKYHIEVKEKEVYNRRHMIGQEARHFPGSDRQRREGCHAAGSPGQAPQRRSHHAKTDPLPRKQRISACWTVAV